MAVREKLAVTCSRCKSEIFIDRRSDLIYETGDAKGWLTISERHHLCPQCAVPFKRFMTWFFDNGQCPHYWRFKKGEDV